jgi:hypothetical protein
MTDYSNIQRVVIRKPVSSEDIVKAYGVLAELNLQIDIIKNMADHGVLPKIIVDHIMMNIDAGIERAVQLSGFANADDMKYYIENFKDL